MLKTKQKSSNVKLKDKKHLNNYVDALEETVKQELQEKQLMMRSLKCLQIKAKIWTSGYDFCPDEFTLPELNVQHIRDIAAYQENPVQHTPPDYGQIP